MKRTPVRIALLGALSSDPLGLYGEDGLVESYSEPGNADAVVIANAARNPYELARDALTAGRSVLFAAPLSLTQTHMLSLAELSRAERRILRFVEPYRHLAGYPLMRRLLSGREPFWKPLYVRSQRYASRPEGVSMDSMVTPELAFYDSLFSATPVAVLARTMASEQSGLCAITVFVEYEDGPPFQCMVSQVEVTEAHNMVVVAAGRMLTLDQHPDSAGLNVVGLDSGATRALTRRDHTASLEGPMRAELAAFLKAVANHDLSYTNAERWARVSSIWTAAGQSLRTGVEVAVTPVWRRTSTPPPLTMIEGGGGSTTRTGPRPVLTLVAG